MGCQSTKQFKKYQQKDYQEEEKNHVTFGQQTKWDSFYSKYSKSINNISTRRIMETVNIQFSIDSQGRKKVNEYTFIKNIGQGSFAKIKLAIKGDQKFAVKVMRRSYLESQIFYVQDSFGQIHAKNSYDDLKKEISVLKKLQHKNIVNLHEVIESPDFDKIFLVMDYCEKGQLIEWNDDEQFEINSNLTDIKYPLSENFLRKFMRECILGIYHVHSRGILHRDINPQNILIDSEGNVQICDFGIAINATRLSQVGSIDSIQGTEQFMAPELLDDTPTREMSLDLQKKIDVWALGVSFYATIFLKLPFYKKNCENFCELVKKTKLKFPKERPISLELQQFLKAMMEKNPQKRKSLFQLSQMDWINIGYDTPLHTQLENNEGSQYFSIQSPSLRKQDTLFHMSTIVKMKLKIRELRQRQQKIKTCPDLESKSNTEDIRNKFKPNTVSHFKQDYGHNDKDDESIIYEDTNEDLQESTVIESHQILDTIQKQYAYKCKSNSKNN